ncbi:outer membrane protein assembly factor BamC, partial [Sodalis-like endosymbiont of Proechinophthirus fluctus]|uniref:outer membrane protein assembly factor BamC n=1 Tax=Sodalis-like endosymbiont of Proechinophthirus fluctus TaxID=1462730 RepID=UPI00164FC2BD
VRLPYTAVWTRLPAPQARISMNMKDSSCQLGTVSMNYDSPGQQHLEQFKRK